MPAGWDEAALRELQDPSLQQEAEALEFWEHGLFDDISLVHMQLPSAVAAAGPSRSEFLWALRTLQSRTVRLGPEDWCSQQAGAAALAQAVEAGALSRADVGAGAEEASLRALVPLLDMANHRGNASPCPRPCLSDPRALPLQVRWRSRAPHAAQIVNRTRR